MRPFAPKSVASDYYALLERLHGFLQPRTYVEIGFREGQSFALAKTAAHSVAIDPAPAPRAALPSGAKLFRMTSDAFFAEHDLRAELGGHPLDLAFIDGMHLFEFVLRDFINLEKYCERGSTILVHDCYPIDEATAARERTTTMWSGDVWKLVLCLKKNRPDLRVACVDVPPTGLGIIRNLDPSSTVLSRSLPAICDEFIPCEYERIAADKAGQLNRIDNDWAEVRALLADAESSSGRGLLRTLGLGRR